MHSCCVSGSDRDISERMTVFSRKSWQPGSLSRALPLAPSFCAFLLALFCVSSVPSSFARLQRGRWLRETTGAGAHVLRAKIFCQRRRNHNFLGLLAVAVRHGAAATKGGGCRWNFKNYLAGTGRIDTTCRVCLSHT